MKTKIYLNEWFINAGIIGFIRILEHNNDNFITIKNNYIEFDINNLKNFHKYYFKYFYDKYNVAEKLKDRIENSFEKIKRNIESNKENKETKNNIAKKKIEDNFKSEKKYIKQVLKLQLDKIKKIDEITYEKLNEAYNEFDKIKINDDTQKLDELKQFFIENFKKENINSKITLNLFKSVLSNSYFGQPSFFNVSKSSLKYEEQQEVMYKDYISNIIEDGIIIDITKNKYNVEELKQLIIEKENDELITKEAKSIYTNIYKKYIQKQKKIEDIILYIKNNVLGYCLMCEENHMSIENYTESNFIPLAISSSNMTNFFWNQKPKIPICPICKLLLFCIPAGVTSITKTLKENNTYKEKEILSFVNYNTDVETLLKINNYFTESSKKDKTQFNPYGELILNIVGQEKKISEWQLQNILVVEFEAEYLSYSRMQYFNIKRNVAKLFRDYSNLINSINDYKYKLQIIDYILKEKDLTNIINERLRAEIQKEKPFGFNSYLATKVQYTLDILKKEDYSVKEEIKLANSKAQVMYNIGNEINSKLKRDNKGNKLDGYIYKMLNCIKTNNRKDFTDIAIRVIWESGKDIPQLLVKDDENINWQKLGHSFIAGLTSSKKESEENKEESIDE